MTRMGLYAAGSIGQSVVARLNPKEEVLGPVVAPSLRLASRIANQLRAGDPVREVLAFAKCSTVLISVPETRVAEVASMLAGSGLCWCNKLALLCDSTAGVDALQSLRDKGAHTGAISILPSTSGHSYLFEGQAKHLRLVRKLWPGAFNQFAHIPAGGNAAFRCAWQRINTLIPMLAESDRLLRLSGIPSSQSSRILQEWTGNLLNTFQKSGRVRKVES